MLLQPDIQYKELALIIMPDKQLIHNRGRKLSEIYPQFKVH